jgi:tRNA dimethylallyltransferase
MAENKPYLISIIGPTAVGKTSVAIELAQHFNTHIISADSRQFYRELSIGTAKPTPEELAAAPHHFVNNLSIAKDYNASDFEKEVLALLPNLFKNNRRVLMCGGSGMYVDAVNNGFDRGVPTADQKLRKELKHKLESEGIESLQKQLKTLDPVFYKQVDLQNSKRLLRAIEVCLISGKPYSEIRKGEKRERPFSTLKIGLNRDRQELYERINRRVDLMVEQGLLDEVKAVSDFKDKNALKTVGYREFFDYLDGSLTFEEAIEKVKVNSRRYAKRQLTWFKRDSEIKWFAPSEIDSIIDYIEQST